MLTHDFYNILFKRQNTGNLSSSWSLSSSISTSSKLRLSIRFFIKKPCLNYLLRIFLSENSRLRELFFKQENLFFAISSIIISFDIIK